jgi:peroxiredoxin
MLTARKAPDFALPDVSGEAVSLESLEDKKIIAVIFGCNHCPYVKAYLGRIIRLQERYAEKGVAIVMINPNNDEAYPADSFEEMKIRAKEKGFNFSYLRDETAETARAYEAKYTPEVFLLDEDRKIRYRGRIDDCWHSETGTKRADLQEAIEDLLARREVAVKSTTPIGCTIKWPEA